MKRNHAPTVEYTFKENKDDWTAVYHQYENTIIVFLPGFFTLTHLYEKYEHEGIHAAIANLEIDFFEEEEHKIMDAFIWYKEITV